MNTTQTHSPSRSLFTSPAMAARSAEADELSVVLVADSAPEEFVAVWIKADRSAISRTEVFSEDALRECLQRTGRNTAQINRLLMIARLNPA